LISNSGDELPRYDVSDARTVDIAKNFFSVREMDGDEEVAVPKKLRHGRWHGFFGADR
jgi:hypothetical protein